MASLTENPHLLLLPPPPKPSTRPVLSAAYRSCLTNVLTKLKAQAFSPPPVLVIALACPILSQNPNSRRKSLRWKQAQSLLAGLYSLIAHICVKEGIDSEMGGSTGSIDVRVILVDYDNSRQTHTSGTSGSSITNGTPVMDLADFASRVYPWKTVFHCDSEEGHALLAEYLKFSEPKQTFQQDQLVVVDGGLSLTQNSQNEEMPESSEEIEGFKSSALGGTFDHLHLGHKLLLYATVLLLHVPAEDSDEQSQLIVGLSDDELLVNKKFASELEDWTTRSQAALAFLATVLDPTPNGSPLPHLTPTEDHEELHALFRSGTVLVRLVRLHDAFGPPIKEEALETLCLSGETRAGGKAINDKRKEIGWKDMVIHEVEVLDSKDISKGDLDATECQNFADKISSTAIRKRRAEEKGL